MRGKPSNWGADPLNSSAAAVKYNGGQLCISRPEKPQIIQYLFLGDLRARQTGKKGARVVTHAYNDLPSVKDETRLPIYRSKTQSMHKATYGQQSILTIGIRFLLVLRQ